MDQVYQVDETKYSLDPLHGIGGPMTWVMTKIMKLQICLKSYLLP